MRIEKRGNRRLMNEDGTSAPVTPGLVKPGLVKPGLVKSGLVKLGLPVDPNANRNQA